MTKTGVKSGQKSLEYIHITFTKQAWEPDHRCARVKPEVRSVRPEVRVEKPEVWSV